MPRTPRPIREVERQLAAIIRGELARRQMQHSSLADKINLSRNTVSRLLNARIHMDIDQLADIATVLQLKVSDLWLEAETRALSAQTDTGRNPAEAKVALRDRLDESRRPSRRSTPDEEPNMG